MNFLYFITFVIDVVYVWGSMKLLNNKRSLWEFALWMIIAVSAFAATLIFYKTSLDMTFQEMTVLIGIKITALTVPLIICKIADKVALWIATKL